MGLLRRLFGQPAPGPAGTGQLQERVPHRVVGPPDGAADIEVVGESYHQDAIERIAGPKTPDGYELPVRAVLTCEPTNPHDPNAVRVDVCGELVGYVPRHLAPEVSRGLAEMGGAIELDGIIVGGWRDRSSEGHFGVQVWCDRALGVRLGVARDVWPATPPPGPGEVRLTPTDLEHNQTSTLTVTCEEHYQDAIAATRPSDWRGDKWPVIVAFRMAEANPHAKAKAPTIEVIIGGQGATCGYLTPAMTQRYLDRVVRALADGLNPTAAAIVTPGEKGGTSILRVKATMPR